MATACGNGPGPAGGGPVVRKRFLNVSNAILRDTVSAFPVDSSVSTTTERPSKTAELVCASRALHRIRSASPVFNDDMALRMCSPFWRKVVSSKLLAWLVVDNVLGRIAKVIPVVFTRARFGEDLLVDAVENKGLQQYVILGAGYETLAMRREDLADRLTVYELDQPATQNEKRARMKTAGIPEPPNVRYIDADLNEEELHVALGKAGFDFSRPALFSWFGVTYYLEMDTVRQTLKLIASKMAPGSGVVFDYLCYPSYTPVGFKGLQESVGNAVANRGEPWLSAFNPNTMATFLQEFGYRNVVNVKPDEAGPRYFSEQKGLTYPAFFGLCHAST